MFSGEKEQVLYDGVTVTEDFLRKTEKYQNLNKQIQNEEGYRLLGHEKKELILSEGARIQDIKHNDVMK